MNGDTILLVVFCLFCTLWFVIAESAIFKGPK